MSGSYQQLLQKYNQLLALVINNPGGFQNLNSVLGLGNTTTNSAIFQVGSAQTSIAGDEIEVKNSTFETQIYPDSTYIRTSSGTQGITLFAFGTPEITVTGVGAGDAHLFPNELSFDTGASAVGISKSGTGLNIKTNGTLTFQDLVGSPGDVLTYDGLGNAVWDSIPSPVIHGTAIIPAGTTTGTIPFGTILGAVPTVTISQFADAGENIHGLAVTGITTSNFTWKSNAPNFGKILWIATL